MLSDIDWKGGILHSRRFLVCMGCSCASFRLDIPSVHLISHVFLRGYVFESFDIHLSEGLAFLFCRGSNVQRVLQRRINTGKWRVGYSVCLAVGEGQACFASGGAVHVRHSARALW